MVLLFFVFFLLFFFCLFVFLFIYLFFSPLIPIYLTISMLDENFSNGHFKMFVVFFFNYLLVYSLYEMADLFSGDKK